MNTKILSKAIELYSTQHIAPLSPGQIGENGNPQLCAAAMLAYVGLIFESGEEVANNFSKIICERQNKELIYDVFSQLGWNQVDCNNALAVNDTRVDKTRKKEVIEYFTGLINNDGKQNINC